MVLGAAQNATDMKAALGDWVDQRASTVKTTADLPEWAEGAETPMLGEFTFYPESGMDRETWNAVRAAKAPAFCYVQGMESMACVMLDKESGYVSKLGVQTFPG
jgi:hypothetical protein